MMLELTRKGKQCYVQFSAILFIRKRFFFRGSIIGMVGGTRVSVDQDPGTIISSVAEASRMAQGSVKDGKK